MLRVSAIVSPEAVGRGWEEGGEDVRGFFGVFVGEGWEVAEGDVVVRG